MNADDDELIEIDLDAVERKLMVLVLNEYAGSAQVALSYSLRSVGKSSYDEWGDYVFPLMEAIDRLEPLTDLDWARALFSPSSASAATWSAPMHDDSDRRRRILGPSPALTARQGQQP